MEKLFKLRKINILSQFICLFTSLIFTIAEYTNVINKNIIYGKVDFIDDGSGRGKTKPINPIIFDLTPLYYLNNLTKTMSYKSSKDAVKALDTLLDL